MAALLGLCCHLAGCETPHSEAGPLPLDAYVKEKLGLSSYKSASTDLNDDGSAETILYATDPRWCGSGGCTLFIVAHERDSFRLVSKTTVTHLPVRLLDSATKGWRDLSVVVSGGGLMEAQNVKLAFDGASYPSNPTMPPASRMKEASGNILIP
ncbi:MAG: hypothetical protein NBV68_14200 [Erythrobacter sp.]|uniref:hypothetical protein n=1 Tax=Erythrobacter sp. TaxID=1042 RepID=UPI0025E68BC5|nr:hypothetical protein [Erythrobacter sp.]MCM0000531.1 hypothetical protein [Erythrobacter sp.]